MKKTNEVYILLGVLGLIIAVFAILSGGALFDGGVIQTFAFQFPEFGLLTLGMMIAILTGGINMSLVSTAALSGILGAMVLSNPALEPAQAITLGIVVCMVSAAAMGALNGAIISFLNVPPMLVTIGTMTLFEGISLNLTEGGAISGFPEEFFTIGTGSVPVSYTHLDVYKRQPVNPEETKMEEKELKTVDNKADGDSGKLDKIETLLREQQEHNRKMLRSSHTHTVILIIFVVVFAIGLFALNATVSYTHLDVYKRQVMSVNAVHISNNLFLNKLLFNFYFFRF